MMVQARPALDVGDRLERAVCDQFDKGAGNLEVPTKDEFQAYKDLVASIREGHADTAAADKLSCEVVPCDDGYVMLQEKPGHERGWGTVVYNLHPSSGLIVEVPHPGFDWGTPELGWQAFKAFNAAAYVVAGAHRGNRTDPSPDVPAGEQSGAVETSTYDPWHHADTVPDYAISDASHSSVLAFEAAHEGLLTPGCTVLQVHGFNAQVHHGIDPAFPADEQVVLTHCANDHANPPTEVAMQAALTKAGYVSEMVDFSDDAHSELGAVVNVQHTYMDQHGLIPPSQFIHMEVDTSLRKGPGRDAAYASLIGALKPVFNP